MVQHEKDAIVDYLEFCLVEMIKKIESTPSIDASAMYHDAYMLLNDIDSAIQVVIDIGHLKHNNSD